MKSVLFQWNQFVWHHEKVQWMHRKKHSQCHWKEGFEFSLKVACLKQHTVTFYELKMVSRYICMVLLGVQKGGFDKRRCSGSWMLTLYSANLWQQVCVSATQSVHWWFCLEWWWSLSLDVGEQGVRALCGLRGPALPGLVRLHVLGEVVAPHEPLAALLAPEALLPRVRAQVPLQLVGPGEALPAEEPVADEGPLPGVPAQVRLQVRGLLVHLAALRDVADVQSLLAELQPPAVRLAVGAFAASAAARGAQQPLGGALEERGDLRLVAQHQLSAQGEGVVGRGGVGLGQAPPLLPFLHVSPRQVVPGGGVLEEAGEVLCHTVVLRVVGAAGLRLRGQDFHRGQFEWVGWGRFSGRGERQLMVVVVMGVMVMMVVTQAGLHVSGELHLRNREGHLVGAEGRAGRHLVAPELKHSRCGTDGALVGELGTFWAHGTSHLPGLATGGGQEGEGVRGSLWRGAGRPVLCGESQTHQITCATVRTTRFQSIFTFCLYSAI